MPVYSKHNLILIRSDKSEEDREALEGFALACQLTGGPNVQLINSSMSVRWVNCEACGGSGEIIRAKPVGAYQEPEETAEICSACEGTGRDCVDVSPVECDEPNT